MAHATTAPPLPDGPRAEKPAEIGRLLLEAVRLAPESCLLIIHVNHESQRGRVSVTRSFRDAQGKSGQVSTDGRTLTDALVSLVGGERLRACPKCERTQPLKNFNQNGYCLACEVIRARATRERKRREREVRGA
ncbi:MAG: hypothetical protein JNM56_19515 [Planctomycetia bacterium]|nr:hypothetical protein [Planctomycetia bacterium]